MFACCIRFLFPPLYFHESWLFILGSLSWLYAPTFSFLVQRWVGCAFSAAQGLGIAAFMLLKVVFSLFSARVKIKYLLKLFCFLPRGLRYIVIFFVFDWNVNKATSGHHFLRNTAFRWPIVSFPFLKNIILMQLLWIDTICKRMDLCWMLCCYVDCNRHELRIIAHPSGPEGWKAGGLLPHPPFWGIPWMFDWCFDFRTLVKALGHFL